MASSEDGLKPRQASGTIVKPRKMVSSYSKLMKQAAAMDTSVLGARLRIGDDSPVANSKGIDASKQDTAGPKSETRLASRTVKRKAEQVLHSCPVSTQKTIKPIQVFSPTIPSSKRVSLLTSQGQARVNTKHIGNQRNTNATKGMSLSNHPPLDRHNSLQNIQVTAAREGRLPLKSRKIPRPTANGISLGKFAPGALARSFRPPPPSNISLKPLSKVTKKASSRTKPSNRKPTFDEDGESVDSFIADSEEEGPHADDNIDYRSEIRQIFARRNAPTTYDDDEEDDDAMEVSGLELEREERRATKLARLEDDREARLEERRILSKIKRKFAESST